MSVIQPTENEQKQQLINYTFAIWTEICSKKLRLKLCADKQVLQLKIRMRRAKQDYHSQWQTYERIGPIPLVSVEYLKSPIPGRNHVSFQYESQPSNYEMLRSPSFFIQSSFKKSNYCRILRSSNNQYHTKHEEQPLPSKVTAFETPSQLTTELYDLRQKINSLISQCRRNNQSPLSSPWFDSEDTKSEVLENEDDHRTLKLFDPTSPRFWLLLGDRTTPESRNIETLTTKLEELQELLTSICQEPQQKQEADGVRRPVNPFPKIYRCKYCAQEFPKACSLGPNDSGHISRVHKDESITNKQVTKSIKKAQFTRRRNKLLESCIQREAYKYLSSVQQ